MTVPPRDGMRPRMCGFLECLPDGAKFRLPDLYCPHGHRMPWECLFPETGFPRCAARASSGRAACGAQLLVQFFPRLNAAALPLVFVAEVSYEEIRHIMQSGMDAPAMMRYLGLVWSPRRRAG